MEAIEERANGNSYTQRFVHIFAIVSHRPAPQMFVGHLSDHFHSLPTLLSPSHFAGPGSFQIIFIDLLQNPVKRLKDVQ